MTITFQYIECYGMSSGHEICKFSEFCGFFSFCFRFSNLHNLILLTTTHVTFSSLMSAGSLFFSIFITFMDRKRNMQTTIRVMGDIKRGETNGKCNA